MMIKYTYTALQIKVWEEIARRALDPRELPPTVRELGAVVGQGPSVIYHTLNKLERTHVIVCPRNARGIRRERALQIRIWPASFGMGANPDLC